MKHYLEITANLNGIKETIIDNGNAEHKKICQNKTQFLLQQAGCFPRDRGMAEEEDFSMAVFRGSA